jgi:hypothetical protein
MIYTNGTMCGLNLYFAGMGEEDVFAKMLYLTGRIPSNVGSSNLNVQLPMNMLFYMGLFPCENIS